MPSASSSFAAAPTLEHIRQHRAQASHQLEQLFAYLEEHLFDLGLTAGNVWKAVGIRDHSFSTLFRDHTGKTLAEYIRTARLEVADRMLRSAGLPATWVSNAVGYQNHTTFIRNYKALTGKLPSVVARKAEVARYDDAFLRRVLPGDLAPKEARDFLEECRNVYPGALEVKTEPQRPPEETLPRIVVDGERYVRSRAEDLWQDIRGLPPEAQRAHVRRYLFKSSALFDLLREKSREEGRRDRQRGIQLAPGPLNESDLP